MKYKKDILWGVQVGFVIACIAELIVVLAIITRLFGLWY